jgi:hypothetical protein
VGYGGILADEMRRKECFAFGGTDRRLYSAAVRELEGMEAATGFWNLGEGLV